MLLWQRQNSDLNGRAFFTSSYFITSVVCHLIVCASFLLLYKGAHTLVFDASKKIPTAAQVRLLPLSMAMPTNQKLGVKGGKKGGKGTGTKMQATKKTGKPATQVLKQPTLASKKQKALAQKIKNEAAKKKRDAKAKGRLTKKDVASIKKQTKKPVEEKKAVPEKIQEPAVQEPVKQVEKAVEAVIAHEEAIAAPATKEVAGPGPEGQEFIYVTQQELDALQIQQKLQECLFDLWVMPAGVASSAVCEVVLSIGWDGSVVGADYLQKSSILIYDLSVQEAVEQAKFPHEVWGKQITILFKP